jgi:hypothetical protein
MIKLIFFVLLVILIVLLLILATGGPAVFAQEEPTPYITATAPMPGDPPPSQDWLDGVATREAAFQQTKDARYHLRQVMLVCGPLSGIC